MLVHPDLTIRVQMKSILDRLGWTINQESSLSGALEKIRSYEPFDVVCVSLRYERRMLGSWVDTARAVIRGRYSVYSAVATKEDRANPSYEMFVKRYFDAEISESVDESLLENYKKQVQAKLEEKKIQKLVDVIALQLGKNLDAVDHLSELTLLGKDVKTTNQWLSISNFHEMILKSPAVVKIKYLDMLKSVLLSRSTLTQAEADQDSGQRVPSLNFNNRAKVDFVIKKR